MQLRRAIAEAQAADAPLHVALLITPAVAAAQLEQFRHVVDELRPHVETWLVYDALEHFGTLSPTAELAGLARQHLADYYQVVRFGGSTNSDFLFIRLNPPPPTLDMACFALNPQVHAFDNASMVETLAAQGVLVTQARGLAGGRPVAVTPITLKPCVNPYTTTPEPDYPPVERRADARQRSLFGAAWTVGSVKYIAENGAASATYYETIGPLGVMDAAGDVFPLYHVIADVGEFAGGEVIPSISSDALQVDGLTLRQGGRLTTWLANMTAEPQRVIVRGVRGQVCLRVLDETTAEMAMRDSAVFRLRAGEERATAYGALELDLCPYAVARIDHLDRM